MGTFGLCYVLGLGMGNEGIWEELNFLGEGGS